MTGPWIVAIVGLLLQLFTLAFYLGFYFGTFKEFKKKTEESLGRLESVYFSDVKIVRKDSEATSLSIREREKQ